MASILSDSEVDDLWRSIEASSPPEDLEVFRFPRAVDNVESVGGLTGWTAPSAVRGFIRPISPKSPIDEFGEPARETARIRCRYTQLGLILAGDVLRDSRGRVWLVRQPQEHETPFPSITAVIERVPENFVPAAIRSGATPTTLRYPFTHCGYATWTETTDDKPVTAYLYLETALASGYVVQGFSNRGVLDPAKIVISADRLRISYLFEDPIEAPLVWVAFAW